MNKSRLSQLIRDVSNRKNTRTAIYAAEAALFSTNPFINTLGLKIYRALIIKGLGLISAKRSIQLHKDRLPETTKKLQKLLKDVMY